MAGAAGAVKPDRGDRPAHDFEAMVRGPLTGASREPIREVRALMIVIHGFPREDERFRRAVEETLARTGSTSPEIVESHLRASYPRARIVVQSPLARMGVHTIWYAYRDQAPLGRQERLVDREASVEPTGS